jgi:GNAT superfamily N-acetyltransferase
LIQREYSSFEHRNSSFRKEQTNSQHTPPVRNFIMTVKKCRSTKHQTGGCGNPRCPEGQTLKAAVDTALASKDINTYIEAKSKLDAVKAVDKTQLPSFDEADDLEIYAQQTYPGALLYRVYEDDSMKWTSVTADIKVKPEMRSAGIGRHLRRALIKHCDEKKKILFGVPTNEGDGTELSTPEEQKAHNLTHRRRLEKFYLDSGYEYNYCYKSSLRVDPLTKEPFPSNEEWKAQFTPEAQAFLAHTGFYIRWPKGVIPKNMLAKKPATK